MEEAFSKGGFSFFIVLILKYHPIQSGLVYVFLSLHIILPKRIVCQRDHPMHQVTGPKYHCKMARVRPVSELVGAGETMGDKFRPIGPSLDDEPTQTIELTELFTRELTTTGSFDVRGGIWKTTFGKVIQALPIPTLLIDQSFHIVVANQAWGKISLKYEEMQHLLFSRFFPEASVARRVQSILEDVFSTRKPVVANGTLETGDSRIWARMTFRSIRVMEERFILILVEDLTADKQISKQNKQHREELEKRVKERTSELMACQCSTQGGSRKAETYGDGAARERAAVPSLSRWGPIWLNVNQQRRNLSIHQSEIQRTFRYNLEDIPNGREWFRRAYPDPKYRHNAISKWIDDASRAMTGQERPRIFTVRCRDGTQKTVSFIPLNLPSGDDMLTCEDITERRGPRNWPSGLSV